MLETGIKGYLTKNQNQTQLEEKKKKVETKIAFVIKNSRLKRGPISSYIIDLVLSAEGRPFHPPVPSSKFLIPG
jgi:hypothetical protein